ncbi:hypothetical protein [Bacillus alkalisoli]|uniref:hypothetical protein n=1 Tax=Bacillus alkalisoli TaxID=2011008 RepID=UPI000C23D398|nr:hypothetical protein [Bacillus alkalisoli]
MLEKKNFFAFKIPIAVVLVIIPGGIFFCWVPFLFPGTYGCKSCGREFSKPREMDWREFEKYKKEKEEAQ